MEKFEFISQGKKISAVLSKVLDNGPIAICCHGFLSNKDSDTNLGLQQKFNQSNINTLRFDFFAHGESEGELEDITVSKAVDNILQAISWAKHHSFSKIALIGSSFGGISSIMAASKTKDIVALALKSPVCNYFDKELFQRGEKHLEVWREQGYQDIEFSDQKFRLNYSFVEDFYHNDGYQAGPNIHVPTMIVHGDQDKIVPINQSQKISKLIPDCELKVISGANHYFGRPGDLSTLITWISNFVAHQLTHSTVDAN